jgi:hypothetical protein
MDAFDVSGHSDDRFWARPSDLVGVGFLETAEKNGDQIVVGIRCRKLLFYFDSSVLASIGDLYNLKDIPLETRVAFSGNVRSITAHGVRLGRLHVRPCDVPIEKAVLTPIRDTKGRKILFGEICIPDPDPDQPSFIMFRDGERVQLGAKEE